MASKIINNHPEWAKAGPDGFSQQVASINHGNILNGPAFMESYPSPAFVGVQRAGYIEVYKADAKK